MNIVWTFWKLASIANSTRIYSSGNPKRIIKHIIRKRMYKNTKGWFK